MTILQSCTNQDSAPVADASITVTTTSLTIDDVTRDDSGEYQITASNVVKSDIYLHSDCGRVL